MDMSLISKNLYINYNSKLSDGIYQQVIVKSLKKLRLIF